MAHFRLPVPIILWAAKPPGSRDLTYFSRLTPSTSFSETEALPATAPTVVKEEEATTIGFSRRVEAARGNRTRGKDKAEGLEETEEEEEEEKGREEEKATVRAAEVAIGACSSRGKG